MKNKSTKNKLTTSENLEKRFDDNEDVTDFFDLSKARIVDAKQRLVVDVPEWFVKEIDEEANRCGVARQALLKMWMVEKLDEIRKSK